nr:unnamed protein product [Callosobruchus analis]
MCAFIHLVSDATIPHSFGTDSYISDFSLFPGNITKRGVTTPSAENVCALSPTQTLRMESNMGKPLRRVSSGTSFGKHLVQDLDLKRPCTCPISRKRCHCFRPHSNQSWLFSRYTTGWKCGLHADWTELTSCVDRKLDELEEVVKRRYFYVKKQVVKKTRDEILREKRERERERRRKIREDPVKNQEQKDKERQRYLKQKQNHVKKSVKEMTPREQRLIRKKWKENSKNYRLKKNQIEMEISMLEANTHPPSIF